jgi:hypothetical protein
MLHPLRHVPRAACTAINVSALVPGAVSRACKAAGGRPFRLLVFRVAVNAGISQRRSLTTTLKFAVSFPLLITVRSIRLPWGRGLTEMAPLCMAARVRITPAR